MRDIDLRSFKRLTKLKELDISGNKIRKLNLTCLTRLELDQIDISGNNLENTQQIIRHLYKYVHILDVSDNHLGDIGVNTFGDLDKLQVVTLRRTNLKNFDIKMINLSLYTLDISYNSLYSADFSSVHTFYYLRILNISWNLLSELKGLTQETYPNLKYLYIEGNRFTCKYISDLSRKHFFDHLKVIGKI